MMQKEMVSIILPVYNAKRFLALCLDSILRQTYQKWELIAVDDGSVDESLDILKSYASKDRRVRVISKQNEGVSVARNVALEQAEGEYIYFVDSDDLVLPEALAILVRAMDTCKATLVKSDFLPIDEKDCQVFINKKQVIRRRYDGLLMDSEKFYRKIVMKEFFLWACLFRKDMIDKHHIRFIPHCRLMEDAAFMVDYLLYSNRNVYKDACVYGYRKYDGTASAVDKDYSADLMQIKKHVESVQSRMHHSLLKNIENLLDYNHGTLKGKIRSLLRVVERMRIVFWYYVCK